MSFKKYQYKKMSNSKRLELCNAFEQRMKTRRSVREFSKKEVSQEIIEKIVRISASAPSGANKEPWYFSIVRDRKIKKEIRMGFLEQICKRPENERAYLLIPVGLPSKNARVPVLKKKSFNEYCEVI